MFRDAGLVLASCFDSLACEQPGPIKLNIYQSWNSIERDPLGREKLEFRLGHMIQLLLRSEGGDAQAREELRAIV